jgi:tryptophan-rich sensory protein
MIDHCYAVSSGINFLFFSLITTLFTLMSFNFMYLFLENKKQIKHILHKVIFNLEKLDNNTYAFIKVRHPQYTSILQGFVLLRVIILLLIFLYTKRPHHYVHLK